MSPTYVGGPAKWGTNYIARYFPNWKESWDGPSRVSAEVDASAKKVTSLYVNDHANTNIWRSPPTVNVPTGARLPELDAPAPARPASRPSPPPSRL